MKNVCFVGCGDIARQHAQMLQGRVGLYFYSRTQKSAEDFYQAFKGEGIFFTYVDVINSKEIDAVVLCSPPEAHKGQIVDALAAGKNVLVEKPMVVNHKELQDVAMLASHHKNQFVMVAENYHYKPSLTKLQKIIKSGVIGDVQEIYIKKMFTQGSTGWKEKYGALFEGGVHFVAFCTSLMDRKKPTTIEAQFPSKKNPERTSHLVLHYDQGVKAVIDYSWETPDMLKGVFQHSYIQGTKGRITFESNGLYIISPKGFRICDIKGLSGRAEMMEDFLDCLKNPGKKPEYDVFEAAKDLEIIFDAYKQANRNIVV
ncbi:MAG: Gfo/Idh/MocA family oxidoreductase [Bdellovibrionales bacterium]|nr:Gfo/Idh/MocA family oxidoreductase [Bdellovibrionales bacterium]